MSSFLEEYISTSLNSSSSYSQSKIGLVVQILQGIALFTDQQVPDSSDHSLNFVNANIIYIYIYIYTHTLLYVCMIVCMAVYECMVLCACE